MKTVWKTIVGLIFDDWWLAGGILLSIAIAYFALAHGLNSQWSGWLLLVLIIGTLMLSLGREYVKKVNKK